MSTQLSSEDLSKRLLSLDFLRGLIMFLLVMESTGFLKYYISIQKEVHSKISLFNFNIILGMD